VSDERLRGRYDVVAKAARKPEESESGLFPTSLQPPEFDPEERAEYAHTLDLLNDAGTRYMVGGLLAINAHTGIWRKTKDFDVYVLKSDVEKVLEAFGRAGFEVEIADPVWLAKAKKGSTLIDFIFANANGFGSVDESWFRHAREATIFDRPVLVIPAEEMLLAKLFVGTRDRWDLADVLHLIFVLRGELDWERILTKIGEHRELLLAYLHLYRYVYPNHAHYVPSAVFEDIYRGRCQSTSSPGESQRESPNELPRQEGLPRFRGTMLDDVSFRVDVEAFGLPDEREATRRMALKREAQETSGNTSP
jgi:hypothetical protein